MERRVEFFSVDDVAIEYSVMGKGEPILVFHGGHSNCNEEFGYKGLVENGYSIITPSRAGYGKTSEAIGESLTAACEYYAKLLDHLRIDQVHVLAISAGGPTGIRFASLFPERVTSLTLESAVSKEWLTPKDLEYKAAHIIFRPSVESFTWKMLGFFSNSFSKLMFNMMSSQFSSLSKEDIKQRIGDNDVEEFKRMNNRQRSGSGFLIDLKQTKELTGQDLRSISSPVLILHSKNDGFIPLEHPFHAHQNIPHSEISVLDSWGHLIWIGKLASERDEKLVSFLESHKLEDSFSNET
ncbi:alpha/beta fold hydrolase [Cytobacillus firmus]|uniref:alpha/beta fold hydrolase n=1 Tax=Cytobacillus firmus TaxID=1399 RepID=UPI00064E9551|nr:alpha/beta hydrolase [Cytobacillus firmus]KML41782.1 hydrolase [Cytobacillus firmus]